MIIAVDTETRGLDATKFLMGCLIKETGKTKYFYKKEDLWNYILELGRKEQKRGKVLTVYSHNAQYDFYAYANLEDKNIHYFCLRPFIADYIENGECIIKFLDSWGIFRMSLKKAGEIIGLEKMEMEKELLDENKKWTKKELETKVKKYVTRDTEIVLKGVEMVRDKMREIGVKPKRIYTIGQMAINYLMERLAKDKKYEHLLYNARKREFYMTKHKKEVHGAYRGGRVECFKTGKFEGLEFIDCNSLYGHASRNIKFPDLQTERKIDRPLRFFTIEKLISKIGLSRVLICNKSNKLGLLMVRTNFGNWIPKENKYIVGTYTHLELEEAIKEGYEILDIEWSIIYEETINPFKEITPELYKMRIESGNKFDKWLYKELQNESYGKMAQRKSGFEIVNDNVEEAKKYIENNWKIIRGIGYNYMYQRDKEQVWKRFYAPIIPTLINAYARVYMYREFKKIPLKDLLYTDTDSCIMEGEHIKKFKIGEGLGEFKIEEQKASGLIYGRKTYLINGKIKIAGFKKDSISEEDFEKGLVESKKMITIKSGKELSKVGGFEKEFRDLKEEEEEHKKVVELMQQQEVYIDEDIKDINYFVEKLRGFIKPKDI